MTIPDPAVLRERAEALRNRARRHREFRFHRVSVDFTDTDMEREDEAAADLNAAARIVRAVAAAPGQLRDAVDIETEPWLDWFDALADAVGEGDTDE